MDEPTDYHEEDVVPVRVGKVCERCSRLLHYKKFERVLYEEDALKQGYRAAHTVKQEWKICRDCQRKLNILPKSVNKLTPDEIIEAAIKGRVRQPQVANLVRRALRRVQVAQSESNNKRWAQEWAKPWVHAIDVVATELERMTTARKYNLHASPHPTHRREIIEFINEHQFMLRELRRHFKDQMRSQEGREQRALIMKARAQTEEQRPVSRTGRPRGRPRVIYDQSRRDIVMLDDSRWRDYLHPALWRALDEKWAAVPVDVRTRRMRIAPLLVNEADELCLRTYNHPLTGAARRAAEDAANPRLQAMLTQQKAKPQPR